MASNDNGEYEDPLRNNRFFGMTRDKEIYVKKEGVKKYEKELIKDAFIPGYGIYKVLIHPHDRCALHRENDEEDRYWIQMQDAYQVAKNTNANNANNLKIVADLHKNLNRKQGFSAAFNLFISAVEVRLSYLLYQRRQSIINTIRNTRLWNTRLSNVNLSLRRMRSMKKITPMGQVELPPMTRSNALKNLKQRLKRGPYVLKSKTIVEDRRMNGINLEEEKEENEPTLLQKFQNFLGFRKKYEVIPSDPEERKNLLQVMDTLRYKRSKRPPSDIPSDIQREDCQICFDEYSHDRPLYHVPQPCGCKVRLHEDCYSYVKQLPECLYCHREILPHQQIDYEFM